MASNAAKVRRRALALNKLTELSDLLAEHLKVEVPNVQIVNKDPELAEIQRIEGINELLGSVLTVSGVELPAESVEEAAEPEQEDASVDLEKMTKGELLELAEERGVDVPKSATKAKIIEALE